MHISYVPRILLLSLLFFAVALGGQPANGQTVRETVNFDEGWKFHLGEVNGAQFHTFDDSEWRTLDLPHDWSIEGEFSDEYASGQAYLPGGVGWYRKTFTVSSDEAERVAKILFDGVYQNSEVWINGHYLGKRPFGFISFSYDLTEHLNYGDTPNVLAVRVDHSNYADSRWYTGSGITRHVWLKKMNPIHVGQWGTFVRTSEVAENTATLDVTTTVVNESSESKTVGVKSVVKESGRAISSTQRSVRVPAVSERAIDQTIRVENPSLWSPERPDLYNLVSEVQREGAVVDQKETTFGIRTFRFDSDQGFFLNGESMLIKGVCLHNDAGALGSAVPVQEWRDRLEIMKEMGANAIRTSHNPPAPELLRLADEMGFLVMDEAFDEWELGKKKWIQGRNVGQDQGAAGLTKYYSQHGYSDFFEDWAKRDIQAMVKRDRNHPSVILWSIGNEVDYPNDPYTDPNRDDYQKWRPSAYHVTEIARHLYDYVTEVDTTRPVTAAVANTPLANETGYAAVLDVVGYNYQPQHYEEHHRQFPDRKILGSENGDSYESWLAVKNNDYVPGQFLWTGIDYLGEAGRFPNRSFDGGLVSLSNVRKPGFYYRKSLWTDEPMVYLAAVDPADDDQWPTVKSHWTWEEHQGADIEVVGYTNADEVELYLNGESLGTRQLSNADEHRLNWTVPYETGTLRAVARTGGEVVARHELRTAGEPSRVELAPNRSEIQANGRDISSVRVRVTDDEGIRVPGAEHRVEFSVTGPGENIGVGNGDHDSIAPYKADYRNVYEGRARVIIQSTGEAGEIEVQAESERLESDAVTITAE